MSGNKADDYIGDICDHVYISSYNLVSYRWNNREDRHYTVFLGLYLIHCPFIFMYVPRLVYMCVGRVSTRIPFISDLFNNNTVII